MTNLEILRASAAKARAILLASRQSGEFDASLADAYDLACQAYDDAQRPAVKTASQYWADRRAHEKKMRAITMSWSREVKPGYQTCPKCRALNAAPLSGGQCRMCGQGISQNGD